MTLPPPARPPCCAYCHAGSMSAFAADQALALAGGAHDRLDHAGEPDLGDRTSIVLRAGGKAVGRGRQLQLLCGQATDALAIHGEVSGAGSRDHPVAFCFQLHQRGSGNRFDLGHDQVGTLGLDDLAQRLGVEHGNHMTAVGDLHGRRIGVAVDGDHLDAEALQLDRDLLAELAGAEQQDLGGVGGEGGADCDHDETSGQEGPP